MDLLAYECGIRFHMAIPNTALDRLDSHQTSSEYQTQAGVANPFP